MVEAHNQVHEDPTHDVKQSISLATADYRHKIIDPDSISYHVDLSLPKGDWYGGKVTVVFSLRQKPSQDLFLDFHGQKVGHLRVNGAEPSADHRVFRDHKVYLPTSLLAEGQSNTVSVFILNKYRKDGCGLHSFVDGIDKQQYLYTQFEPDHCHFVFPCFEQPNLKATWTLRA